jgi:hypothetical protein
MMKEGAVPVPSLPPCTYSNDGVLPVRWLSHSGELKRRVNPMIKNTYRKNLLNEQFSIQLRFVFVNP